MATPSGGYRNKDGKRVPSVTTVLGRFKDSGGLIKWAYNQGREHEGVALRNREIRQLGALRDCTSGATQVGVEAAGEVLLGDEWWDRELEYEPAHLYDVTAKAAEAGSIAHDLIEDHCLTGRVQEHVREKWETAAPDVIKRAWNSYHQFVRWQEMTKIRVIETETGGVSELHQYGGTFDGLAEDNNGDLVLIDWKTSNAVYGEYLIQLAAYAQIVRETSGREVKAFHLLRVRKETADFSHHSWENLDEELEAFILMRRLYEMVYRIGKRA